MSFTFSDGGLRAFAHALDNRADQRIPTSFLMKLLKLVLQGNYFEFNDKLFLQLIGAAMGTRVACSYACLFMAFHEINKLLGEWNGGMPHHLIASRYISTSPLGLLSNHHARSGLEASQRCKHSDRIALPELVNKFNVEKRSCFTLVIVNSACITFDADAAEAHTMFTYSKAMPPAVSRFFP